MSTWQLQQAKASFSEVVKLAETEGPQHITVHGKPAAVLLSQAEYERLSRASGSFVEFVRRSPLHGQDLDLTRSRERSRKVRL